jgi:hypothetical protein
LKSAQSLYFKSGKQAFDQSTATVEAYIEFNLPAELRKYALLLREYHNKDIESITDMSIRVDVQVARDGKTKYAIKRLVIETTATLRTLYGTDIAKKSNFAGVNASRTKKKDAETTNSTATPATIIAKTTVPTAQSVVSDLTEDNLKETTKKQKQNDEVIYLFI